MGKRVRTTKHKAAYANQNKLDNLHRFLKEYRRLAQLIVDDIWENGYDEFSIQDNNLNCPKYIDYKRFDIDTFLTARALSSLVTQVAGIIKASVEKQRKSYTSITRKRLKAAARRN